MELSLVTKVSFYYRMSKMSSQIFRLCLLYEDDKTSDIDNDNVDVYGNDYKYFSLRDG